MNPSSTFPAKTTVRAVSPVLRVKALALSPVGRGRNFPASRRYSGRRRSFQLRAFAVSKCSREASDLIELCPPVLRGGATTTVLKLPEADEVPSGSLYPFLIDRPFHVSEPSPSRSST